MDINEDYFPNDPIYYNYGVKNFLMKDIALFAETNEYSSIILCVYKVNTNGKFPFLEYLLINNGLGILTLPSIPIFSAFNKSNLISYSKVFLSGILQVNDFKEFDNNLDFDGFYEFGQNLHLFFDVTKCKYNLDDTYLSCDVRFALTDEIINHKKICNICIDKEATDFFLKNDSINYLYDGNNEAYEIPIVGFVGKPTPEKVNFVYTFGESSKDKTEILGPYYYFTNFYNAIREGGWSKNYKEESIFNKKITDNENGRYIKGGIIRFALFTGQTKYIENMPNDPIDDSEIKKFRIEDNSIDRKIEILTLRISDHNGNWAKNYDSVYLGNIELDDGSLLNDTSKIVLKEYNQQVPLSSHFINKSKLADKFDSNNLTYSIV
jgi:hypothetical protein